MVPKEEGDRAIDEMKNRYRPLIEAKGMSENNIPAELCDIVSPEVYVESYFVWFISFSFYIFLGLSRFFFYCSRNTYEYTKSVQKVCCVICVMVQWQSNRL